MNVLAIDTATEACSAALAFGGGIIERYELAPRKHAELILPMIESLLREARLTRRDLNGIAVGRGPGAFTGVRLAISVAQGLALGLELPVVPVSSLAALALTASDDGAHRDNAVLAVIDARMGEVYAGTFLRRADGMVEAVSEETVGAAQQWAPPRSTEISGRGWSVVGTGWDAYRDVLAAKLVSAPTFTDGASYPRASAVLRLALPRFAAGEGLEPEAALPIYLRDKVALTLEEQRAHKPARL